MAGWSVHEDGSFSFASFGLQLQGAYPYWDGVPLRPVRIDITTLASGFRLTYRLAGGGMLTLALAQDDGSFVVRSRLSGRSHLPARLDPIGGAALLAVDQLFVQGLGFGGPSGFHSPWRQMDRSLWESYGLIGLTGAEDQGLMLGALDHRRFLCKAMVQRRTSHRGLVNRHLETDVLSLQIGFHTEGVAVEGDEVELPEIRLRAGPRVWETYRTFAGMLGSVMGARSPARPTYHYCSWYRRGCHFDRQDLDRLLSWLSAADPRLPLQAVQIDDCYAAAAGDWLEPNGQWPGGLASAFAAIKSSGFRPGIWVAPFMVGSRSRLFREHPDWVLRTLDGAPVIEWRNYGASAIAAHHDEETYALDTSHPEAMAYLRTVFTTMHGWGCRFFKTDFMDWGLKDSASVRRHTPGKTSVEHFREVLAMIRECIGEDSYWLGCIMPFMPSIGAVDGMRIANDCGESWSEGSTGNMIAESFADQYFNNLWWQNDPDVVYLRDRYISLSDREIRSLAYWHGVLGVSINTSDYYQELPAERLDLWHFLEPDDRPWTAMMPRWNRQERVRVAAREYRGLDAWALVVLNPLDTATAEVVRFSDFGVESAFVFAWEPGRARRMGKLDSVTAELPAHGAQLYFLSQWGEPPPPDLSLGGKLLSYWLIGASS